MMLAKSYTLMIVEDDPDIRAFLCNAIAQSPRIQIIASAGCLEDAHSQLQQQLPDVLLVDLGLPDGSGVDLIRMARSGKKKSECMVITIHADKHHLMEAFEAGAKGYLLKDTLPEDITASIIDLIQGGSPISPMIARTLLARFEQADSDAMIEHLTGCELNVLKAMTRGLTRREIASQLTVSIHTIHSHIKNIYGKLEVNSNVAAIQKAQHLHLISTE